MNNLTTSKSGGRAAVAPNMAQVKSTMAALGIEYSEEIEERHLKLMFWGATSTRKTETVLRNFPNVLLIDSEGNSDQCVRNKAIPPFQRVKTQDSRKLLDILDAAGKGLIRMPNGDPIMTVCIDSVSVFWGVQQEVASALAEQRAAKKNWDVETANVTMQDWGKAKRPLKALLNRFSKGSIPILILIAREKDLYQELPGGDLKKIGVTPNAVKDTEYDMNLALRFFVDEGKRWGYEVTKVQGGLNELFPIYSKGSELPLQKLLDYASRLKPINDESISEDETLADKIASSIIEDQVTRTQANLITIAQKKGFSAQELGAILKAAGFKGFDAARWDEMVQAVEKAAEQPIVGD